MLKSLFKKIMTLFSESGIMVKYLTLGYIYNRKDWKTKYPTLVPT
jgi:hypothetical protein